MNRFLIATVAAFTLAISQQGAVAQGKLDTDDIVDSLRGLEQQAQISAPALYQRALARIKAEPGMSAVGRPSVAEELNKLPQLTVEIQFNFDSDIIRPASYRTLGRIADALYHPYLLDYKFLVVGHTDATGKREYNLKLSQRRANAIREALVTTFRISPARVAAVGLGEEQLQDPAQPTAAVNRRVQLIATGKIK